MAIIVVSYSKDAHAQYVLKRMAARGMDARLVDLGEYPASIESGILIGKGLDIRHSEISDVTGVWWRRPLGAYRAEPSMLEKYVASESEAYVRSLQYYASDAIWISDPDATRSASRKPLQLLIAKQLGWRIPETCFGNSVAAAQEFLRVHNDVIVKPMSSSFVRLNAKATDEENLNRIIYARRVSSDFFVGNEERIKACPFILQERIKKGMDIRVTVVGDTVFAAGIRGGSEEVIDWRHHTIPRVYEKHTLPADIEQKCRDITQRLGLRFGCIDLGLTDSGYVFFEINPQGQWLPSELKLAYPISDTLIDLLRT